MAYANDYHAYNAPEDAYELSSSTGHQLRNVQSLVPAVAYVLMMIVVAVIALPFVAVYAMAQVGRFGEDRAQRGG